MLDTYHKCGGKTFQVGNPDGGIALSDGVCKGSEGGSAFEMSAKLETKLNDGQCSISSTEQDNIWNTANKENSDAVDRELAAKVMCERPWRLVQGYSSYWQQYSINDTMIPFTWYPGWADPTDGLGMCNCPSGTNAVTVNRQNGENDSVKTETATGYGYYDFERANFGYHICVRDGDQTALPAMSWSWLR